MMETFPYSVVVPFYNEGILASEVLGELHKICPDAEIIAVNDGSTDNTLEVLKDLPYIRLISFHKKQGQSAAVYAGLRASTGRLCVTMDGDGQNDPSDIVPMTKVWAEGKVVCGYRQNRRDSWSKRVTSRLGNGIRRRVLNDGIRDTGCSLKVFPRSAVDNLPPFNGLHRFLPAFFKQEGLELVEVPVNHRPRLRGESKYTNLGRAWRGLWDLAGVAWLLSRRVCPGRAVEIKDYARDSVHP